MRYGDNFLFKWGLVLMQNEQNNTVTVIFKSKVDTEIAGGKFCFKENKKYEINKNE